MTRDGLIAEYRFAGNADDTAGRGFHGRVHGATLVADRFGNADSAYRFDAQAYISVDPPPPLDASGLTVSAWVRYDARDLSGWTNCIVAQDDGNDEDQSRRVFQLSTEWGRIIWHRMCHTRDPICRRPVRPGVWFHAVATYRNEEHRLYVDGELHDTIRHRLWTHPAQPLHIGRKGTAEPFFFFKGDIDDVRIYNRALSLDEVRELFSEDGWQSSISMKVVEADPVSGQWGQRGVVMFDLDYDGETKVSGRIMARDPGHMAPISEGSFDRSNGAIRLAGTARHPENGSPVPFLIEGRLADREFTVAATFEVSEGDVHNGNYILTRDGARGGWWKNSFIRWRLRKLLGKTGQRRRR